MALVQVEGDFEKAFKKFKKIVEKEGILTEVKRREFYEKPSVKKKENKELQERD